MREIIIDLFAGGGGASEGIEQALGVCVDEAVNHDPAAIAMHLANHPSTRHHVEDVFKVNPMEVADGRPVGLLWASPDCTHFSKAKGGKPVKREIRSLAWVVIHWAQLVRPRIIVLENVPEFRTWGPLDENNRPDKRKAGMTFRLWCNQLRGLGYQVQFKELSAADYGAPTIRTRLFMIARCDGEPIVWPEPSHGPTGNLFGLKPYRTAAECIDWSLPCPSIFDRKKPLAEATLRRIAKGIRKFVIEAGDPFIVTCNHGGQEFRGCDLRQPMKTVTAARDAHGLVMPFLSKYYGGVVGTSVQKPAPTVTAIDHSAIVAPFLTKYHGAKAAETRGQTVNEPLRTMDTQNRFGLAVPFLSKFYGTNVGSDIQNPMPTITATGQHIAEVRAFLVKYYGCGIGQNCKTPVHTVTVKDRMGLVAVSGVDYQIVDIGLRMLQPRELARAQGFADSYVLTGNKTDQVAKLGNSVCPPIAKAIIEANVKLSEVIDAKVG